MKKRSVLIAAAAALVLLIGGLLVLLLRQPIPRHRVFRAAPAEKRARPPSVAMRPVDQWTGQFRALEISGQWNDLAELLERIEKAHPAEYAQWSLAYLHARALIENNEPRQAASKLAPFLAAGNPFRDLALFHQAEIDDARVERAAASAHRQTLIFEYPQSIDRDQAIDEELEHLTDLKALAGFTARLTPTVDTRRRRDLGAQMVEGEIRAGDLNGALTRGPALLIGGTADDASDRVSRALDRPELIRRMNPQQLAKLGDAMQNHRHFDRAVALLSLVPRSDEIQFAIGRSYFGDEKYAQAQQAYMRGANSTRDMKRKATFLFHASRAAQLQGNDAAAEQLMTAALAVPGRHPATSAALTQRLRTRLKQRRFAAAAADLTALRKGWPKDHALAEGALAYAIGMLGAGNGGAALTTLNSIPRPLQDKYDPYEIAYWRARALENANPRAAFAAYLGVLRAPVATHFAYFARERLDAPSMQAKLQQELASRDSEVTRQIAAGNWEVARLLETDRYLLSPRDSKRLADIYRHLPPYAAVIDLQPLPFPSFPLPAGADRPSTLLAMGLFDEAADAIPKRYGLRSMRNALTQSLALNHGNASRDSIYAIEVMMNSVPRDYVPQLLPLTVRELLYPRFFYEAIADDATKFGADPTMLLSIMREESRFNPRARSEAAARGLLQFIITTARDIGREIGIVDVSPDDLYDPRVIIRLGAKYISTLSGKFDGNRYDIAAAYNAGPHQVALWQRLAPAAGDDYFLSSINFDETKHYVRKVMNSYKRYAEIYGGGGPVGGVRVEP